MGTTREVAVFAAGCFWGKEYFLSRAPGVVSTRVGFTGGHTENPTYVEVCKKQSGHAEAVEVTFDPTQTSFRDLAILFFEMHDPTRDRTGNGGQYRSAIFIQNEEQRTIAEELIKELTENGFDIKTQLEPSGPFWEAEERHQQYCDVRDMKPRSYFQKRF